jgi:hypothetical protein
MAGNPLVDAALNYARRGWAVFPVHTPTDGVCSCGQECSSIGKHPRTNTGLKEASTDPIIISAWWDRWPDANIGMATGPISGLDVIDVDAGAGGLDSWAQLQDINGPVETLSTITGGGGNHFLFISNGANLRNTAGKLGKGIDTRGDGGYIILPPSVHVSGNRYEWDNRVKPSKLPVWVTMAWASKPETTSESPSLANSPDWVSRALSQGAPDHERNNTAHRLAGYFRSKGLPRDVVASLMEPFASRCQPPMELRELYQAIDSAQRYAIQVAAAGITDPPMMEERAGQVIYTWETPAVRITLEQVHKNKQGLMCEITVDSLGDDTTKDVVGPVGYNMTSVSGREGLVKNLSARWDVDWRQILQTLSRLANEHLRAGNPIVDLREYTKRPQGIWALRPLILDDQPTIIFGAGGLGKSLVGLAAMLSLNTETAILPGLEPMGGHKGVYLDWESTSYEHGGRFSQIMTGAGLTVADCQALHLPCAGTLSENVGPIKRHLDEQGITFAIIDSAGLACGGEPEKAEAALGFFTAVRYLGVPCLVIAHQVKGDSRKMPFGSVYWHNSARATWEIRNQQSLGENLLRIGLFARKSNVGALEKPLGFSFTFSMDSIQISSINPNEVPEIAEGGEVIDRIKAFLADDDMTVKELAEHTGKTESTIRTTLNRYKDKGVKQVSTNMGQPKWGLDDV